MEELLIDETQIEQVFINLFLNAVQATKNNGRIFIKSRVDRDRDCIKVTIGDNGCGIPEEDLPKIFEPFFSTKPQGTGLGLSVTYGIMQNHKATIKVLSRPGEGTEFRLEFPLNSNKA
jgi:signal transduction histidine kinase